MKYKISYTYCIGDETKERVGSEIIDVASFDEAEEYADSLECAIEERMNGVVLDMIIEEK